MNLLLAAAAGGPSSFVQVWLGPIVTILSIVLAAILGPQWVNRRNARVTSNAAAEKDTATAAQVTTTAMQTVVEEWRKIADRTKAEQAETERRIVAVTTECEDRIETLTRQATAAQMTAEQAQRRAQVAEVHSAQAESRARDAERQVATLSGRVRTLERTLTLAGIKPPPPDEPSTDMPSW